jgi:hypothetical protein
MGSWWSYKKKLCDDILQDSDTYLIRSSIRSHDKIVDSKYILNFLQKTQPVISYIHNRYIMLLYDGSKKRPVLRSNISGDILSTLSSEIAIYCIKNNICEPYTIDIDITLTTYEEGLKEIINTVDNNNYEGYMYGIDNLSKEKIKEQFNYNFN